MTHEALKELIQKSARKYYFPEGTDEEIKYLISDYIMNHQVMYNLANSNPNFEVRQSAQKGFTVSNGSIVFRVLWDYKDKNGHIAVNFPNWRGWEEVLPLDARNHFLVKGSNRKNHNGYKHSFLFKNKKEFIQFFNRYMLTFAVE